MIKQLELKIKIYKASNNLEACKKFERGHSAVLKSYGIKKLSSSNTSWFFNPSVYLLMVESLNGDYIYGGARLQIRGRDILLPLEEAVGNLDPNIHDVFNQFLPFKVAELCGLWNVRDMAGSGLSLLMIRVGIAKACLFIANQLELDSVFVLAAPWTLKMVKSVGFIVEDSIGNNGTFPYQKPDLLATVCAVRDIRTLKSAQTNEREIIFDLRKYPIQKRYESGPKANLDVEYYLMARPETTSNKLTLS